MDLELLARSQPIVLTDCLALPALEGSNCPMTSEFDFWNYPRKVAATDSACVAG